jgi:hypothetical protein
MRVDTVERCHLPQREQGGLCVIKRETVTVQPLEHDYILGTTGLSWNVRRSNGNGAVASVSEAIRDKHTALLQVLSLAEADHTDAWETVGTGVFWRLKRFRPADEPATAVEISR